MVINWPESEDNPIESVTGMVKRIVFHNDENGFQVLSIEANGHQNPIVVVGNGREIHEGETVTVTGKWKNHKKFGRQFVADHMRSSSPNSTEGMKKYLSSRAVEGIGAIYAEKLVNTFGDKLFNVIEFEPDQLQNVEGIGPRRAQQIKEAWDRQRDQHEAMLFLYENGIGSARAARIYKKYQSSLISKISKNPYRLIEDFSGIGFKIADELANKVGFAPDDMRRVRAGLNYLVGESAKQGSCGLQVNELITQSSRLLEVDEKLAEAGIRDECKAGRIVLYEIDGEECAFLVDLFKAEDSVSERIKHLMKGSPPWKKFDSERALNWVEKENRIELSDSQARAVMLAVSEKFTIITGGPGVGKTTIVNAILKILSALKVKIKMCAPTGRAAKRMTESTGRMAFTIHRLLVFETTTGGFRHNKDNQLKCDLVIVDEASMIDIKLMNSLLQALPNQTAVILVGDVDQLPSIGPGQVLSDIIDAQSVPVARLTEVFRQASSSQIISNAHRINAGQAPDLSGQDGNSDFYFVRAEEPEDAASKVLQLVTDRIPSRFNLDPIRDIQVLCPMIRGTVGVQSLNLLLQEALNPSRQPKDGLYALGDKVMQTKNNYEVSIFNGDIGYITSIIRGDQASDTVMEINFDGRIVELESDSFDGLTSAYAVTIHKSQGSEFPAVVMPIMKQHYVMLQRKLLYTGVTRGKKLVVLVGQKAAIQMAIRGIDRQNKRLTRLKTLLN